MMKVFVWGGAVDFGDAIVDLDRLNGLALASSLPAHRDFDLFICDSTSVAMEYAEALTRMENELASMERSLPPSVDVPLPRQRGSRKAKRPPVSVKESDEVRRQRNSLAALWIIASRRREWMLYREALWQGPARNYFAGTETLPPEDPQKDDFAKQEAPRRAVSGPTLADWLYHAVLPVIDQGRTGLILCADNEHSRAMAQYLSFHCALYRYSADEQMRDWEDDYIVKSGPAVYEAVGGRIFVPGGNRSDRELSLGAPPRGTNTLTWWWCDGDSASRTEFFNRRAGDYTVHAVSGSSGLPCIFAVRIGTGQVYFLPRWYAMSGAGCVDYAKLEALPGIPRFVHDSPQPTSVPAAVSAETRNPGATTENAPVARVPGQTAGAAEARIVIKLASDCFTRNGKPYRFTKENDRVRLTLTGYRDGARQPTLKRLVEFLTIWWSCRSRDGWFAYPERNAPKDAKHCVCCTDKDVTKVFDAMFAASNFMDCIKETVMTVLTAKSKTPRSEKGVDDDLWTDLRERKLWRKGKGRVLPVHSTKPGAAGGTTAKVKFNCYRLENVEIEPGTAHEWEQHVGEDLRNSPLWKLLLEILSSAPAQNDGRSSPKQRTPKG